MPSYTVQKGDTLSGIASKVGLGSNWGALGYSGDPRKLQIGTVLNWGSPAPAAAPAPAPTSAGVFAPPSDNSDLTNFAATQKSEMQKMLDRQKAEQDALFNQYKEKIGGQERSVDAYKRLRTEMGLPDLEGQMQVYKDQIYGVKDLIDRLEEDVNARTSGTFTNESQRRRQIAYEETPLNNQLARLGTGMAPIAERLNSASSEVGTLLNLQSADQSKELKPYELEISAVSDRFAREMTGFTTSKQTELDALMDKISRGRELADREWQLAQTLAAEEREWARTKEKIALEAKAGSASSTNWAKQLADIMGGGGSAGSGAAFNITSKATDIADTINQYFRQGKFLTNTENTLMPMLYSNYKISDSDQAAKDYINKIVYEVRKPYEAGGRGGYSKGAYLPTY